jgi:hypothetical protein
MPIDLVAAAITLILGLAIGCLVGWLASRPGVSRLQGALEKDRAVHAERLKAYGEAQTNFREAFQALSADALKTNNEAFLSLAETRLRDARTQATGDIEARKKAIEELLAPWRRRSSTWTTRSGIPSAAAPKPARSSCSASSRSTPPARACATRRGGSPTPSSVPASAAAGASSS